MPSIFGNHAPYSQIIPSITNKLFSYFAQDKTLRRSIPLVNKQWHEQAKISYLNHLPEMMTATPNEDQLHIFWVGADGAIWTTYCKNGVWNEHERITNVAQLNSQAKLAVIANERTIHLFWIDNHGRIRMLNCELSSCNPMSYTQYSTESITTRSNGVWHFNSLTKPAVASPKTAITAVASGDTLEIFWFHQNKIYTLIKRPDRTSSAWEIFSLNQIAENKLPLTPAHLSAITTDHYVSVCWIGRDGSVNSFRKRHDTSHHWCLEEIAPTNSANPETSLISSYIPFEYPNLEIKTLYWNDNLGNIDVADCFNSFDTVKIDHKLWNIKRYMRNLASSINTRFKLHVSSDQPRALSFLWIEDKNCKTYSHLSHYPDIINFPLHSQSSSHSLMIDSAKEEVYCGLVSHQGKSLVFIYNKIENSLACVEFEKTNSRCTNKITPLPRSTSLLLNALSVNEITLVRELLMQQIDINVKDDYNNTAVSIAVQNECFGIATLLVLHGADLTIRNNDNLTVIHLLSRYCIDNPQGLFSEQAARLLALMLYRDPALYQTHAVSVRNLFVTLSNGKSVSIFTLRNEIAKINHLFPIGQAENLANYIVCSKSGIVFDKELHRIAINELLANHDLKPIIELAYFLVKGKDKHGKQNKLIIMVDPDKPNTETITAGDTINAVGVCYGQESTVYIAGQRDPDSVVSKRLTKGTLIHEICHYLALVLYNNSYYPYHRNSHEETQFTNIVKQLQTDLLNKLPLHSLLAFFPYYPRSQWNMELIVRIPQLLTQPDGMAILEKQCPEGLKYFREVFLIACKQYLAEIREHHLIISTPCQNRVSVLERPAPETATLPEKSPQPSAPLKLFDRTDVITPPLVKTASRPGMVAS